VGAVLYSTKWVKCSALPQATIQNTTTTHNNQHEQLLPYSPVTLPLSLHGQGKVAPKSLRRCSPTTVRRPGANGLALCGIDPLVWGTKKAPIKKRERDGAKALHGRHSTDQHNNQPKVGGIEGYEVGSMAR
jgi:hypothetical protein